MARLPALQPLLLLGGRTEHGGKFVDHMGADEGDANLLKVAAPQGKPGPARPQAGATPQSLQCRLPVPARRGETSFWGRSTDPTGRFWAASFGSRMSAQGRKRPVNYRCRIPRGVLCDPASHTHPGPNATATSTACTPAISKAPSPQSHHPALRSTRTRNAAPRR